MFRRPLQPRPARLERRGAQPSASPMRSRPATRGRGGRARQRRGGTGWGGGGKPAHERPPARRALSREQPARRADPIRGLLSLADAPRTFVAGERDAEHGLFDGLLQRRAVHGLVLHRRGSRSARAHGALEKKKSKKKAASPTRRGRVARGVCPERGGAPGRRSARARSRRRAPASPPAPARAAPRMRAHAARPGRSGKRGASQRAPRSEPRDVPRSSLR